MAGKVGLPADHPPVGPYVCNVTTQKMDICHSHPEVHSQVLDSNWAGYSYPSGHQSLSVWAAALPGYPLDHDDVDGVLHGGEQYEDDHPNVDKYVSRRSPGALCYNFSAVVVPGAGECPSGVPVWHPSVDAAIGSSKVYPPNHIRTHPLLAAWMPAEHRCAFKDFVLGGLVAFEIC
jgi:hypothetical protein